MGELSEDSLLTSHFLNFTTKIWIKHIESRSWLYYYSYLSLTDPLFVALSYKLNLQPP